MIDSKKATRIARLRFALEPTLRSYVEQQLRPFFGEGIVTELLPATLGYASLVYCLRINGMPAFAVRAERDRRRARQRFVAHRLLGRLGLPVPEIVHADFRWSTRRTFGYYFLVERWLPGRTFDRCTQRREAAKLAGQLFARLHTCTSIGCGRVGRPRFPWKSPERVLRRRARKRLRIFRATNSSGAKDIGRWLHAQPSSTWRHRARLCHGDPNPHNVLLDGATVRLIDLSHVSYQSAPSEIAHIDYLYRRYDKEEWPCFFESYFEEGNRELRGEITRSLPLCQVLHHLECVTVWGLPENIREEHMRRMFQVFESQAA